MGSYTIKVYLKKKMIPHILSMHILKVKCTYNGVRKQCKNRYEYHREKRTEETTNKKIYTCEKRTFDQYVKIFKENNPQVLKSILEYQNEQHKSEGDIESNNDFTQEINDTKDDDVDYKFYYENVLQ